MGVCRFVAIVNRFICIFEWRCSVVAPYAGMMGGYHINISQQPAEWASAHGCNPCRAANGAPEICCPLLECCDGGANPLLIASACSDIISRLAACRSASRSSAVCRLKTEKKFN